MAVSVERDINLEGLEEVFRICGWGTGKAALEHRIAEYVIETDPRIACFLKKMEQYNRPRLDGSPGSDNNIPKDATSDLNYFAPMKNIQVLLRLDWFDQVCADKGRFTTQWREQFACDLMESEHRDAIARQWARKDQRLQIKGHVMGALIAAGVICKKALPVARIYYGIDKENTKEVKTLSKYMGDSRKEPFTEWIIDYVKRQSPIEN